MQPSRPKTGPPSRRRFPRLEVLELVDGALMPSAVALKMIELGVGGFSVRSVTPFPPGARHQFRFTTGRDQEVTIDATAVHCRLVQAGPGNVMAYVSGFEFVSDARSDAALAILIDTLASVFSLE